MEQLSRIMSTEGKIHYKMAIELVDIPERRKQELIAILEDRTDLEVKPS